MYRYATLFCSRLTVVVAMSGTVNFFFVDNYTGPNLGTSNINSFSGPPNTKSLTSWKRKNRRIELNTTKLCSNFHQFTENFKMTIS